MADLCLNITYISRANSLNIFLYSLKSDDVDLVMVT